MPGQFAARTPLPQVEKTLIQVVGDHSCDGHVTIEPVSAIPARVSEEILINVTPSETRVALVENGVLQEVQIERSRRRGLFGNVYKGRVSRVLPGMQAAFVDVGLERNAFLHASDLVRQMRNGNGIEPEPVPGITELVREGQEILVQVVKDPLGTKGARLTTNISLPSRYLVLLPLSGGPDELTVGVSVRIEEEAERERLRGLVQEVAGNPAPGGFILRTNAEGVDAGALSADVDYLKRLWDSLQSALSNDHSGTLIYEELPLALRAVRDLMTNRVEKVRIDSTETYERTRHFAEAFIPSGVERIEHYPGERPIFDLYGVEDEIQRALDRKVPLKSGGYLILDQTEAMTTIDVNTGGYVGHRNLEETIFKTNLEAAQSIARQLRLRNLGGIIIIDFIDMTDEEHKRQVLRMLEKSLARDHAKTSISELSPLGLVEMTRKRTTESLEHVLCEPCPACSGRGTMKTPETVCYEIFREVMRAVRQFDAGQLLVMASPAVVTHILDEESTSVAELEGFIGKTIRFQPEDQYTQEQFDVVLV